MIAHGLETLKASLQTLPLGVMVTRHLLTFKGPKASVEAGSSLPDEENVSVRANKLTETLKNIRGYDHGGLNE